MLRLGFRGASAEDARSRLRGALHVTFDDAYTSVTSVLPGLSAMGVPVTVFACSDYAEGGRRLEVSELVARAASRPDELETMDWDELAGIAEIPGVGIGSHTVTHPHLPRLSDAEIASELLESRSRIEDRLGRPCPTIAYPYGEHDRRVRDAARAAGYVLGFALDRFDGGRDPYAVPRVDLYRRDRTARFLMKVVPGGQAAAARLAGRGSPEPAAG